MIEDVDVIKQLFDLYYDLKERLDKIEKRIEKIEAHLYGDELM